MKKLTMFLAVFVILSYTVSADLTEDIVAYYSLDNNASDITGNGHDASTGTMVGGYKSIINETYYWDALETTDYLNLPYDSELQFGENVNFTISFWVNSTDTGYSDNDPTRPPTLISNRYSSGYWLRLYKDYNEKIWVTSSTNLGSCSFKNPEPLIMDGSWNNVIIIRNGQTLSLYQNGVLTGQLDSSVCAGSVTGTIGYEFGKYWEGGKEAMFKGNIDEISFWNRSLDDNSCAINETCNGEIYELYNLGIGNTYPFQDYVNYPNITSIVCTSCNPPYGDNETPYSTTDTTPTFTFDTTAIANCRISDSDINYTEMGSSRQCQGGEMSTEDHTCTLTSQDELIFGGEVVYVACINYLNESMEDNSTLIMNISGFEANATQMIQLGIENSVIYSDVLVYTDQQVYLRNAANDQLLETVDKVASSGNQRWLFNYDETGVGIGLFNISPVVYSMELLNTPLTQIDNMVTSYIDKTNN